ncbi:MAG: CinA family nicotinamide mononucleotide deamidase-related protein [Tannerella sp.]|jgi:nicotinamide-nucleotide amidase|nr:CinA family nicotinamide mononucleotide deamidase-related protein [Tannerella sp.]
MDVEIITIGDELLIGQVVDTNSAWMGQALNEEGFRVIRRTSVGDVEEEIISAIEAARSRAPVLLLTGGLGPTRDDLTLQALCRYFGCRLHFSEAVYADMERFFRLRGRPVNELTRLQAMVPDRCTVIRNQAGTAPCTWFEREGLTLVSMPGVPSEMQWLMRNEVLPRLAKQFRRDLYIRHQTSWVRNYTESELAMHLSGFENGLPPFVKLAYLPQPGVMCLRLSATGPQAGLIDETMTALQADLEGLLGGDLFATGDKPVEMIVGERLRARGCTVGTAESCTGGAIAALLTSAPGSSGYFVGSIVAYANAVKRQVLGVAEEDLRQRGAVSREVVEQMAQGALCVLGCDYAIATSGIAGPEGGTPDKPVGSVWIAVASKHGVASRYYRFGALRAQNVQRAGLTALLMLLEQMEQEVS